MYIKSNASTKFQYYMDLLPEILASTLSSLMFASAHTKKKIFLYLTFKCDYPQV